jgi:hypothetical protein
MMTENGTFCGHKITPPWKLFFSEGNNLFLFYNFNTATDGGLKNQIFEASFGQKLHPLGNFFFSEDNQIFLFYNFKSATDGGFKNVIFEKKSDSA